jgi:nucleoside-diphosphate-sugar epimerase
MVCAVTGASGYVGSILSNALRRKFKVIPVVRKEIDSESIRWDLSQPADISGQLRDQNVTTLIHAAWDFNHHDAKENERCNVEGSRRLIESAQRAGIQHIVFISTISAFTGARSIYGQSKMRVEHMVLDTPNGAVIRPGLVWGSDPGGMFGALNKQVEGGKFIPLIGSGRYPQYLINQDDLCDAVLRFATGELHSAVPVTVANSQPWLLRDLIKSIATQKGKHITLLPVPWRVVYLALKTAEVVGMKLAFRSDSVLSLVYQNAASDFTPADKLDLKRRAYSPSV